MALLMTLLRNLDGKIRFDGIVCAACRCSSQPFGHCWKQRASCAVGQQSAQYCVGIGYAHRCKQHLSGGVADACNGRSNQSYDDDWYEKAEKLAEYCVEGHERPYPRLGEHVAQQNAQRNGDDNPGQQSEACFSHVSPRFSKQHAGLMTVKSRRLAYRKVVICLASVSRP